MTDYYVIKGNKKSLSKIAELNPRWVDGKVGYHGVHSWIKRRFKKASKCHKCGVEKSKLDLANISQKYKRDITDWEWLCRRCHMLKDGRMDKLIAFNDTRVPRVSKKVVVQCYFCKKSRITIPSRVKTFNFCNTSCSMKNSWSTGKFKRKLKCGKSIIYQPIIKTDELKPN